MLHISETCEKGKGTGKGGRCRGKGLGGGRGTGKFPLLDAETVIAEFKARIQCKHCGKTSHYSDHCFTYQKQHWSERNRALLRQQGLSEEDAMKVLSEMNKSPQFANNKAGQPAAKPKLAAKRNALSLEESEDAAAKKRKRELHFAEVDRIVELLRSAVKRGSHSD